MVCPVCIPVGLVGGVIGARFGINVPSSVGGKYMSLWATTNLVAVTTLALKIFANISLCGARASLTVSDVGLMIGKTTMMGVIYSIAVNYLLNRYIFSPASPQLPPVNAIPACCRQREC